MPFVYPDSDLDRSKRVLALLGSHWSETYAGRYTVETILFGWAQAAKQTQQDFQESLDCVGRQTVPVLHTQNWFNLTIRASDRNASPSSILRYGDGAVYGNQPSTGILYVYGVAAGRQHHEFPLPADLVEVPVMVNRLILPSVTLTEGVDYQINHEDGLVAFLDNPFDNPDLISQPVLNDVGDVIDYEITLWVGRAGFDQQHIYRQWGYLVGPEAESSENYRGLVNAMIDGLVEGGTVKNVLSAVSHIVDIPIVQEPLETVEAIFTDSRHTVVVTDLNVYRFQPGRTVLVSVGDTVKQFQTLTDDLELVELNRGTVPDDLLSLGVGPELLPGGYDSGLVFYNKDVPLVVTPNVDGKTKVEFELGGFTQDVTRFWDTVHAAGVSDGTTLANLLDLRTNKSGEPTAPALPATVNPLEFLVANIFRCNVFVIRTRSAGFGADALDFSLAELLSNLIPPHTMLILVVELTPNIAPVIMTSPATPDGTSFETDPFLGYGTEVEEMDVTGSSFMSMTGTLGLLNATCG